MKNLRITVDGKAFDVTVEILGQDSCSRPAPAARPAASVASASVAAPVAPAAAPTPAPVAAGAGDVPSPLAGKVVSLDAKVGQAVKTGDQILTLEAMKMNTLIFAPCDGTVTAFHVNPGDGVQEGQVLCTLG